MRIVVDIPDNYYNDLMTLEVGENEHLSYEMELIRKGVPLPKGCGRLIDAKVLEDVMYHEAFEVDSDMQRWDSGNWIRYKMFENAIRDAKTIVEADKGI